MTKTEQEIRQELRKFVEKFAPTLAETCTVKSVDTEKETAIVESPIDNTEFEVSLFAGEKGDFVCLPKVGSVVFVRKAENAVYYITAFSEIDKIKIFGGENKGVVKVKELVSEFKKLIDDVNQLKNLFTSWVPVPSDGGAALKTIITSWASSPITPTQQSNLENNKFLH